jgi:PAS domain S-box-containing protein
VSINADVLSGRNILIVEDEIIVAENIRGMLRSFGYQIPPPAMSGEEALRRVDAGPPDLVLMDIQLGGGMDGVEAALRIRTRHDVPIVYLTAHADEHTVQRARASEPYGYLVKPFSQGELRTTIEMAVHRHAIERQIRDQAALWRAILDDQVELVLRFQPDGTVVFANRACGLFFQRRPEELVGLNFLSLIAAADRKATRERLATLSRKTPVVTADARVEVSSGRERRIWWNYTASYSDEGRLAAIQAVGRDITGRWQTEEALRQRNSWLERINQASQTFVASLDLDQVLTRILETLRQQLNVTASSVWLTDEKTGELVCYYATEPNKKVVLGWRLAPGQGIAGWVARTGQSLIVPEVRHDPRHFRAVDDQTGLRIASMLSVPLRVQERVIGVIEVMDRSPNRFTLADQKYVELLASAASTAIENAHLYREANRLRAFNEDIVQSMDEGIMLENEAGIITFVNPRLARWLGVDASEVVGRHWSDILAPDQVLVMVSERSRWPRSVISRYETALLTATGETIPVMVSARSLFRGTPDSHAELLDHPGGAQYVGSLSVFTDIRELKRAEQRVERRLAAEKIIAEISTRFINASLSNIDVEIERALGSLAEFEKADRVVLDLIGADGVTIDQRYIWCADGTPPVSESLMSSLADCPWALERALCAEPVFIPRVSDMPASAAAERAVLEALAVKSAVYVPLVQEKRLAALLAFHAVTDERTWSQDDARLLRLLGETVLTVLARRRAEQQLETSLREREVLLREVHHRVKNNLQVICSLLDLQANALRDDRAARAFAESRNRVRSMALVHDALYRGGELGWVNAADYIKELANHLFVAYEANRRGIRLTTQVPHLMLDLDTSIPLALLVNELISNALTYAFPETRPGKGQAEVRVELHYHEANDELRLTVSDNGIGLPPTSDLHASPSLGLPLVRMLTEQLAGRLAVGRQDGTVLSITFPARGHLRCGGCQEMG